MITMSKTKSPSKYIKGKRYKIKVNNFEIDPNQPRGYFDPASRQDLVKSIKDKDVIQPILFCEDQDGNLYVVAGGHRLQAAKETGLKTIPAIMVEDNLNEIALIETLLREDLTAIEFAEASDQIIKEHNYTQEQLATIIGKTKFVVSKILSLNRLPDEIRNECRSNKEISLYTLIDIAKKKQDKGMMNAYKRHKQFKLTMDLNELDWKSRCFFPLADTKKEIESEVKRMREYLDADFPTGWTEIEKYDHCVEYVNFLLRQRIKSSWNSSDALIYKKRYTPFKGC
jgi:ParB family chromosome partitioning protein